VAELAGYVELVIINDADAWKIRYSRSFSLADRAASL
jgi:hypothetical protein